MKSFFSSCLLGCLNTVIASVCMCVCARFVCVTPHSLTKQCGHAHRRQMPVEWNLLRIRMMAVGSLRLSLLPSTAPGDHGLEMPTTGSDEVDAETGMFRTEDEVWCCVALLPCTYP